MVEKAVMYVTYVVKYIYIMKNKRKHKKLMSIGNKDNLKQVDVIKHNLIRFIYQDIISTVC